MARTRYGSKPMIDENAFGILVCFHSVEDEEYASEELDGFIERFTSFERLVLGQLAEHSPGEGTRALSLGHAVYIEVAEDALSGSLFVWARTLRQVLSEHAFETALVLTHGGRWLNPDAEPTSLAGSVNVLHLGGPSEPLQRALFAHTATRGLTSEDDAWGPGLYLDTDAIDALGIRPKNAPTPLEVAGASFFRVAR